MIISEQNSQVKHVVALQNKHKLRHTEGRYIVEGIKMVSDAPLDIIEKVYIEASLYEERPELVKALPFEVIRPDVFKKMSDTVTPQGILAMVKRRVYDFDEIIKKPTVTLMILEGIQDPGNLGTIIRSAEAIGADGIITAQGSVDAYHPKVLRSTMGAIYHLPVFNQVELEGYIKKLKHAYIPLLAGHLSAEKLYYEQNMKGSLCFLIGNEGNGLTEDLSKEADELIKLPMVGQSESLNASVAASILLYEAYRQKH